MKESIGLVRALMEKARREGRAAPLVPVVRKVDCLVNPPPSYETTAPRISSPSRKRRNRRKIGGRRKLKLLSFSLHIVLVKKRVIRNLLRKTK